MKNKKSSKFVFPKLNKLVSGKLKPETFKLPLGVIIGAFFGLSLFFVFQGYRLNLNYQSELEQELETWKKIAQEHPEYPDAWAKLASIWYNLKEEDLAIKSIKKARKLDPIRKEIRELEEKLIQ